jgi:branched-chain amino acid transport system substrate-binding protein
MIAWTTSLALLLVAAASAVAQPVVVGAVGSETGSHAAAAAPYRNALFLWREEINAAGGLLGQPVELRLADDGSEGARAGAAAAELLRGGASVLIGPFGSAATIAAIAEAERAKRVMLNAGGPSAQVHRRAPRYVFQTIHPYSAYAEGIVQTAAAARAKALYILGRDDGASREMAEAAQAQALKLGLKVVLLDFYGRTNGDFLPQIYKAMGYDSDAWIAFGDARDAADMIKTFKRHGFAPQFFYVRGAAEPRFIELVGQDAEFTLASVDYDPRQTTAGNASFVRAYRERWSVPPNAAAAAGYAAGQVLAAAVARAGTVEPEKLRAALAALRADTVLGSYRVDPATGTQIGMQPVVVQIERGRPEPVWPEALARGRAVKPYPQWNDRQVLE